MCDHWSHNYAFTSTAAFVSWSSWVLYFESQIKRTVQQNIRQTDVHINRHIYNYYYTLRCINRYALLTYLLLHSFRSWEFSLEWVLYWAIVCGYFWDPSFGRGAKQNTSLRQSQARMYGRKSFFFIYHLGRSHPSVHFIKHFLIYLFIYKGFSSTFLAFFPGRL